MSLLKNIISSLKPSGRPPVVCPHCGATLDIEPKRKRKCPACRQPIYPKKLHNEKFKRFVTEEEAARIDGVNKEHYRQKRIRAFREEIRDAQRNKDICSELIARAHLETELGNRDRAWGYFNQACTEAAKRGQVWEYSFARFKMAIFLKKEARHKQILSHLSEFCYLNYDPDSFVSDFPPAGLREMALAMKRSGTELEALRGIFMPMAEHHSRGSWGRHSTKRVWQALKEALLDYI